GPEAATTCGIGLCDVVHGLGPCIVGKEGEAGADALVNAEIHAVVLGGAVAGIDLGQVLVEKVLVGKETLHQALTNRSVTLHDAPRVWLRGKEVSVRLDVGDDITELWRIQRCIETADEMCSPESLIGGLDDGLLRQLILRGEG